MTRENDQKVHPSPRSECVLVLFFMVDVSRGLRKVGCYCRPCTYRKGMVIIIAISGGGVVFITFYVPNFI